MLSHFFDMVWQYATFSCKFMSDFLPAMLLVQYATFSFNFKLGFLSAVLLLTAGLEGQVNCIVDVLSTAIDWTASCSGFGSLSPPAVEDCS